MAKENYSAPGLTIKQAIQTLLENDLTELFLVKTEVEAARDGQADLITKINLLDTAVGGAAIKAAYEAESDTNAFTDAEKTKLSGISTGADVSYRSLAVADLSDPATPSVLTTAETTGTVISNYKTSGADHVFTMPVAHAAGNVIFVVGDEFQVDIEPHSGEAFIFNRNVMAADEHIQNTADNLGETIVGVSVNINGGWVWVFESASANFVEATP